MYQYESRLRAVFFFFLLRSYGFDLYLHCSICCFVKPASSNILSFCSYFQLFNLRYTPSFNLLRNNNLLFFNVFLKLYQVVDLFNFLNDDASSGVELKEWVLRGVDALTFDFTTHEVGSDHFLAAIAECADLDAAIAVAAANSISSPESTSNAPG